MKRLLKFLSSAALVVLAATAAYAQNLSVTGVSTTPSSALPGDTVSFAVSVANSVGVDFVSPATANFTVVLTHLTTGATFPIGPSSVGPTSGVISKAIANPTTGQFTPGTGTFTISGIVPPQTTEAGNYRAVVTMNAVTAGTGAPSTFSVASTALTVTGKPDLQITSLTYAAGTAYVGGTVIPMQLTYVNNVSTNGTNNVPFLPGLTGFPTFVRIQVVLSSNPTFGDADDFQLTLQDISSGNITSVDNAGNRSLPADWTGAAGTVQTFNWNQVLPGNFAGSYYVLAKVDSLNALSQNDAPVLTVNGNNVWGGNSLNPTGTLINLLPSNFPTALLASHGAGVATTASGYSDNPSLSADGRYVAFASDAANLVSGDTNGVRDIFLFDSQTTLVRRLSVSQQGQQGNGASNNPAISANGRYVAFSSDANNLVLGDNNGFSDIFVVDTITGLISIASLTTAGAQANNPSFRPAINTDGRYVVFESPATNLDAAYTALLAQNSSHIYVRDRTLSTTRLVDVDSTTPASVAGNANAIQAAISADGTVVAFASRATNLNPLGATAASRQHVYVRPMANVVAGTSGIKLMSVQTGTNTQGNADSQTPSLSSTGKWIAFGSVATDLLGVGVDTNGVSDIFAFDTTLPLAPAGVRISVSNAGVQAYDPSETALSPTGFKLGSINPTISADGRFVAFASLAANLTNGDSTGKFQGSGATAGVPTVVLGAITVIPVATGGTQYSQSNPPIVIITDPTGTGASATATVGGPGPTEGQITGFTNLVGGALYTAPTVIIASDTNRALDIFVRDRSVNGSTTLDTPLNTTTQMVSVNAFGYQTAGLLGVASTAASNIYPVISSNGRFVAFPTDAENNAGLAFGATNQLPLDSNAVRDVFLFDRRTSASITASTPPAVTITSPGSQPQLVNTPIAVTASATAATFGGTPIGVISSVQFFVNGTSLGSSVVFPYTQTWTPTSVGTYTLSAIVTDSFGNLGVSSNVTVTINAAPSVGITSHSSGTTINTGTPQVIVATASASNPGASILNVQFFVNGAPQGAADTTSPYSVPWTPTAAGTFTLTAVATDDVLPVGTQTVSPAVSVSVVTPGGGGGGGPILTLPVVNILTPAGGVTLVAGTPQTVAATATLLGGTVTSVQFFANGTSVGSATTSPFLVSWTPATTGTYALTAVATGSNTAQSTSNATTVTVVDTVALTLPAVSVQNPADGATVAVGVSQTVSATASLAGGTVTTVQFLANGASIGSSSVSPYSVTWTPATAGTYALTAVATGSNRATATSTANTVTASTGGAPAITLTSPNTGATYGVGQVITLSARADLGTGLIASVQFLANGFAINPVIPAVFGQGTNPIFSMPWTPAGGGTYTLVAVVTDFQGNKSSSGPVTVNVLAGTAPTVSISSPAAGASFPVGTARIITANVSSTGGAITNVQFFANGVALGNPVAAYPYIQLWIPAATGAFTLTAVATDSFGNKTTSAPVSVTATAIAAPTVAVTSPGAGATVGVNAAQTLAATATSLGGTVTSVQFFVNGAIVGVADTTFPYSVSWTPVTVGTYSIQARATDNIGNISDSVSTTVTVAASIPPTGVAVTAPAQVAVSSTQTITGVATAGIGATIANMQFFANGVSLGTDTIFPYTATWTPIATSVYAITATATDSAGNQATSPVVYSSVTATGGPAPTGVAVTVPSPVVVNTAKTITGVATAATGTIASMQFFANGVALGTADTTFPYSTTWTPIATGTYAITATATDSAGNQATSPTVNVAVGTNQSPTVSAPISALGATPGVGIANTISVATATDPDGTIAGVQFFADTTSLGTDTTAPYSVSWTSTIAGSYVLTAVATDDLGATTTSASTAVTVAGGNAPREVAVTVSAQVAVSSTQTITGVATAASGVTIAKMEFFANGVSLGTDTTFPYTATWTPTAVGTYAITATATDSAGNQTTSPVVNSSVTPTVGPAPTGVAVTAPAQVAVSSTQTITAVATAASGVTIARMEFFANGVSLGTDTTFPYTATWTPTATGIYAITAIATDSAGNQATSAVVNSSVTPTVGPAPTGVAVTVPAQVAVGSPQAITGVASAASGVTIASMQFFANGVSLGTDTTFPYTATWTPTATGIYAITATATDSAGNQATSAVANSNVTATGGPAPSGVVVTVPSQVVVNTAQSISGVATAATGTIANVQFFANGVALGTPDTDFPYSATWTPKALGNYSVTAVATDTAGNQTTSAAVAVTVSAFSFIIDTPAVGDPIPVNVARPITASVNSPPGTTPPTIASVQFFANGVSLGTDSTSPYSISWTPAAVGPVSLTAVATDISGVQSTAAPVAVTVVTPPSTTTIAAPVAGAVLDVNIPQTFSVTATAATGTVASVRFFANGVLVGTTATAPFSVSWTPTVAGPVNLTAIATDSFGGQTPSAAVSVSVSPPTVSITAPSNNSTVAADKQQTVTATARSATGTITSVQFFADGNSIGTDSTSPFSSSWTPTVGGSASLMARATDSFGQQTDSDAVTVTVSIAEPKLSVTGITATPSSVKPGDSVSFAVAVTNSGASTPQHDFSGSSTVDFTIVLTNLTSGYSFTLTKNGVKPVVGITGKTAGTATTPQAPGTGTFNVSDVIPRNTIEAGSYKATVTMSNPSIGTIEGPPFVASSSVVTVTGKPDLQITSLTYSAGSAYKGGDVVPMTLTYRNNSKSTDVENTTWVPTSGKRFFRIDVVLSPNPTFGDSDDLLLTFHDVSGFVDNTGKFIERVDADGVNHSITWDQLLPGNFAGSYYVLAKIDALNTVDETVEGDVPDRGNGNNVWVDTNATRIALQPTSFPTIYLASTTGSSTAAAASGNNNSDNPAVTADGRYTVFVSDATNLVSGDTNGARDVFIFDNQTATTRRLSLSQQGQANGGSSSPAISGDGRHVAFASDATNLVLQGDTNGFTDIFVVEVITGAITRESIPAAGGQANGSSFRPALSHDGRYLVFESNATNLSPLATLGTTQIHLRDRTLGTTILVSRSTAGIAGDAPSLQAAISADGRYVAFASDAPNLVSADTNGVRDIFVRDVVGNTTTRVSVATGGAQANGASRAPSINRNPGSASDGRYIAFDSEAKNLVANDTNDVSDIFVYDRGAATPTTTRVSVSSSGAQAIDPTNATETGSSLGSINPSISASGRYVAFSSLAFNLTAGDSAGQYSPTDNNNALDVFVIDRDVSSTGIFDMPGNIATSMVSVNRFGHQTLGILNEPSTAASDIYPVISGDGRWVAFSSDADGPPGLVHNATNRTSPDGNRRRDVFVFDRRINALPNPATLPTVSIISPLHESSYQVNSALTLVASAIPPVGTVARVEFFVNGTVIGTDASFPYTTGWTPNATGLYAVSALVTDSFGNLGASSVIKVTITGNAPPSVAVLSPAGGSTPHAGAPHDLTAAATDVDGTVRRVRYFVNGSVVGETAVAAPFITKWEPTATGTYTILAEATDDSGNVVVSAPRTVTVVPNEPPTVALTSPISGLSTPAKEGVTLSATATDSDGTVARIGFLVNGNLVAKVDRESSTDSKPAASNTTDTLSGTGTWTPTTSGNYVIVAQATDNLGNVTNSAARNVIVLANQPPTATLTIPAAPVTMISGVTVNLAATASDTDGTVVRVRFLANNNPVGSTATTAPYATTWIPAAPGVYSVVAEATDDADNVSRSAATTVTVIANRAPVVAFTSPANGSVIRLGGETTLAVNATDADGTIAKVQFFVDGATLGNALAAFPYRTTWTPVAEGIYRITAAATDNAGVTTNSSTVNVLVTGATSAGDTVVNGIIIGLNESGTFSAISVRGKSITFIGTSTASGANKTYFYSGLPVGSNGSFSVLDPQGRPAISGTFSDISAFGTLDNNRVSFSGQAILFPGAVATVASGYYTGNLSERPTSTVAAIVALDGSLTLYVADGSFQAVGTGAVDATGAFDIKVGADVRFTGMADPASGFLSGTLIGGPGGSFAAATGSGASFSDGSLRNLSTRGQVGTGGNVLIAGFVVGGTSAKQVLIRSVGPTLGLPPPQGFNFPGSLADPLLSLYSGSVLVASNDDWGTPTGTGAANATVLTNTFGLVGAFGLPAGSKDAAVLVSLLPGNYSAQISSGGSGATGIGLVEIYDVDTLAAFSAQKVMNLSTRGFVGANQAQLIAGFVVSGSTAKKVMIRAAGPGLAAVAPGLAGAVLADPMLRLVRVFPDGSQISVRENDSWESGNDVASVRDAALRMGAFPFATGSRDAVILINLPPGTYSAQVTGAGTTTGVALVEVWEVP